MNFTVGWKRTRANREGATDSKIGKSAYVMYQQAGQIE